MRRLSSWFPLGIVLAVFAIFLIPRVVFPVGDKLDPPTLSFPSATLTTITVRVCGGATTGAPAGFSVHWKTEADYLLNAWANDGTDSFASAAFSGVPVGSRFDLGPGECTDVELGNLDDSEIGVSFDSNAPLLCGESYAVRSFAHLVSGGLGRSDFSGTYFFETLTCDGDDDGIADDLDNCPTVTNPDQNDLDTDLIGDACDVDDDSDLIADELDNCPLNANADQHDADGDGIGNVCDVDADNDSVLDVVDSCVGSATGALVNAQGCSIVQLCPCGNAWKNHGAYLSCVVNAATDFRAAGLIIASQKDAIVSGAASSSCGTN
jgi:hypothetical protein